MKVIEDNRKYTGIWFRPFSKDLLSGSHYLNIFFPDGSPEIKNSLGYRAHEFTKNHKNKLHVVFSGCSYSVPDALYAAEGWAWRMWREFKNTSGFFNLSQLGNNIPNMVFDMFKYCELYGMPDKIFMLMPDPSRYMDVDIEPGVGKGYSHLALTDGLYEEYVHISCYQAYYMLEMFCKTNNIELIGFSWDPRTNELLREFETFFVMEQDDILREAYEFEKTMEDKTYAINARGEGNTHPGIAVQYAYYNLLKNYRNHKNNA